jgi:uncharacterized protein HemX
MSLSSLANLIPGVAELKTGFTAVVAILILVSILGGIGYVWWYHSEFIKLQTDNATLTQNNKNLQENNDVITSNLNTCKSANTTNSDTIQQLLKEREDSENAITVLSNQQKSNANTIAGLQKNLNNLSKDKNNDGVLAPDLRETIRGIESAK